MPDGKFLQELVIIKMPFGKYKGRTVGEVFDEDPGYLRWMLDKTGVWFVGHVVKSIDEDA